MLLRAGLPRQSGGRSRRSLPASRFKKVWTTNDNIRVTFIIPVIAVLEELTVFTPFKHWFHNFILPTFRLFLEMLLLVERQLREQQSLNREESEMLAYQALNALIDNHILAIADY